MCLFALGACGGGGDDAGVVDGPRVDATTTPDAAVFVPGPAMALSDSPANDEDPFVLRSVTGTMAGAASVAVSDAVTFPNEPNRYPVYVPAANVSGRHGRYESTATSGGGGPSTTAPDAAIQ